jgi:hypothetical protein
MSKALLAVSHPSHELRLHGWLQRNRPRVLILTDGAGRDGRPRIGASQRTIGALECEASPFLGIVSDLDVYDAILRSDLDFFETILTRFVEYFSAETFELVVGDAAEGFSATHDVFRDLLNTAICIASSRLNREIENFEFSLYRNPSFCPASLAESAREIRLNDDEFKRKIDDVVGYSDKLAYEIDLLLKGGLLKSINRFSEPSVAKEAMDEFSSGLGLEEIVNSPEMSKLLLPFIEGMTVDDFKIEKIYEARSGIANFSYEGNNATPFYEHYGQHLVAKGAYQKPITFEDHMLPLSAYFESRRLDMTSRN